MLAAASGSVFDWHGRAAATRTALLLLGVFAAACSGGSAGSPTMPGAPSNGGNASSVITISNNAVTPQSLTVSRGSRVTFINNDGRSHDMESDPHPTHTDCPELNEVGVLARGQSHQSGVLNTVRSCGYHDHEQAEVRALQGTITIQ
jgi:plastocyanin